MSKAFTFTAPAGEVADAISRVGKAASARHVQVLTGVHMTLNGDELVVQATDMSLTMRERIPVTKAGEGTCVPLDLKKIVAGLKTFEGPVKFTATQDAFTIRNGSTTLRYALGEVEDYPRVPFDLDGQTEGTYTVPYKEFLWTFQTVEKAISKDQSRPVLCSVLVEFESERVRLTSTDSYRLAHDSCSASGEHNLDPLIVTGADLAKVLRTFTGEKEIMLTRLAPSNHLVVTAGAASAALRSIDGQYPNYRQLIPEAWEGVVRIDRRAALKALDRINKLVTDNRPVKLEVASDSEMKMSVYDNDVGGNLVESTVGATFTGEPQNGFPFGANPGFMYDALQAIGGDEVLMHHITRLRPCLFTETDYVHTKDRYPDRFCLLMPVNLG